MHSHAGLIDDPTKEVPNTPLKRAGDIAHKSATPGSDDFPKENFPIRELREARTS